MSLDIAVMTPTRLLVEAKRAVIHRLQDRKAAYPVLTDAEIHHAYNPKLAIPEYVWGGGARFVSARAGMAGRDVQITLEMFFDVRAYAAELEDADVRAGELVGAVEQILTEDRKLGGALPGLVYEDIASGEIAYGYYDDEAAMSSLGAELLLRVHPGSGRG